MFANLPQGPNSGSFPRFIIRLRPARRAGGLLGVVTVRGLVDVNGFHFGKVDRNRPVISSGHHLQSLNHMVEPAIDFLIFRRRGR
jgi:hypothetical protein